MTVPTTRSNITSTRSEELSSLNQAQDVNADTPQPTANGGFTHTSASKAKISAANAGKVPWNKGKQRSEETRRKIAEGVQRRNRERFLQKLKDMGMTEEEYIAQNEKKEREKKAKQEARRTPNGGYRPTEETKQKISRILKQKFQSGEIKRTPRNPETVRRGFTHSEETRRKISEALRNKWATDEEYRDRMMNATSTTNQEVNARISATLRARWQDPIFREQMLHKLNGNRTMTAERRKKISDSIKKKWQDEEFRRKVTKHTRAARPRKASQMVVRRQGTASKTTKAAPKITAVQPRSPRVIAATQPIQPIQPLQPEDVVPTTVGAPIQPIPAGGDVLRHDGQDDMEENAEERPKPKAKKKKKKKKPKPDPVEEVRSDLYDLLFDDDDSVDEFDPYGLDEY